MPYHNARVHALEIYFLDNDDTYDNTRTLLNTNLSYAYPNYLGEYLFSGRFISGGSPQTLTESQKPRYISGDYNSSSKDTIYYEPRVNDTSYLSGYLEVGFDTNYRNSIKDFNKTTMFFRIKNPNVSGSNYIDNFEVYGWFNSGYICWGKGQVIDPSGSFSVYRTDLYTIDNRINAPSGIKKSEYFKSANLLDTTRFRILGIPSGINISCIQLATEVGDNNFIPLHTISNVENRDEIYGPSESGYSNKYSRLKGVIDNDYYFREGYCSLNNTLYSNLLIRCDNSTMSGIYESQDGLVGIGLDPSGFKYYNTKINNHNYNATVRARNTYPYCSRYVINRSLVSGNNGSMFLAFSVSDPSGSYSNKYRIFAQDYEGGIPEFEVYTSNDFIYVELNHINSTGDLIQTTSDAIPLDRSNELILNFRNVSSGVNYLDIYHSTTLDSLSLKDQIQYINRYNRSEDYTRSVFFGSYYNQPTPYSGAYDFYLDEFGASYSGWSETDVDNFIQSRRKISKYLNSSSEYCNIKTSGITSTFYEPSIELAITDLDSRIYEINSPMVHAYGDYISCPSSVVITADYFNYQPFSGYISLQGNYKVGSNLKDSDIFSTLTSGIVSGTSSSGTITLSPITYDGRLFVRQPTTSHSLDLEIFGSGSNYNLDFRLSNIRLTLDSWVGPANAYESINLYTSGYGVSDYIPFIVYNIQSTSGIDFTVNGHLDSYSGIDFHTISYLPISGNLDFYTSGSYIEYGNVNFYTKNLPISGNRAINFSVYSTTDSGINNNLKFYTFAEINDENHINFYTNSDSDNGIQYVNFYTQGQENNSSNSIDFYVPNNFSGTQKFLYLVSAGEDPIYDNFNMYLHLEQASENAFDMYINGLEPNSGIINMYMFGASGINSGINMYLPCSGGSQNNLIRFYNHGF